ncbi:hypothetical protein CEXT_780221 [Caerostris extrusa]|uniref:Uncharacterized protein n=1 Tax=Caerostris extrusa TaxID=172846 RepID=A0AAV4S9E3_CAEEX|nr:hypothetical protein CEXT_780221 [Caerostris extrusa]
MFIIVLLSCIALAHASFVPIVEPYHAPSYEIRHAVRDHLGERGVGRQVNYVADPSGLRAHIRTNEVAAAPQYVSPYLANPYYGSFGHDGLVYPGYGVGYNRFGLGYGHNGPLFSTDTVTEVLWATVVFLKLRF